MRSVFLVLVFVLIFSSGAFAQKPAKPSAGRTMTVVTENAMVFEQPNMDSSAVGYLSAGETIRASKKIYGKDPRFYKVRLATGKFGYVATIDVSAGERAPKPKKRESTDRSRDARVDRARIRRELAKPMAFNTWYGLLLGQMNFKEKISGVKGEDKLMIYGLKITGPDILLQGPVMDLNVFVHLGAPDYYKEISRVDPSGFVFMSDALLLMPFGMGHNSTLYLGLGPFIRYSDFKYVELGGGLKNPTGFGFGASFALGGAYRFGAFSLRLEGKYIAERTTQTLFQLGLQTLY